MKKIFSFHIMLNDGRKNDERKIFIFIQYSFSNVDEYVIFIYFVGNITQLTHILINSLK